MARGKHGEANKTPTLAYEKLEKFKQRPSSKDGAIHSDAKIHEK